MAVPPIPQRKSTFRSRVGGAIRRSSTAFNIPGLPNRASSATPPPPQDADTASITGSVSGEPDRQGSTTSPSRIDTTLPQTPVPALSAPSPIPESPLREVVTAIAEPQAPGAKAPSLLPSEVPKADPVSGQGSTTSPFSSTIQPSESIATTPPPSPPKKKLTLRERMGSLRRRASTLSPSPPRTPNREISATPSPVVPDTASIARSISGKPDMEGSIAIPEKIDSTPLSTPISPTPVSELSSHEVVTVAAEPQAATTEDGKQAVEQEQTVHVMSSVGVIQSTDENPRSPREDTLIPSEPPVPLPVKDEVMAADDNGRVRLDVADPEVAPLLSSSSTPDVITNSPPRTPSSLSNELDDERTPIELGSSSESESDAGLEIVGPTEEPGNPDNLPDAEQGAPDDLSDQESEPGVGEQHQLLEVAEDAPMPSKLEEQQTVPTPPDNTVAADRSGLNNLFDRALAKLFSRRVTVAGGTPNEQVVGNQVRGMSKGVRNNMDGPASNEKPSPSQGGGWFFFSCFA